MKPITAQAATALATTRLFPFLQLRKNGGEVSVAPFLQLSKNGGEVSSLTYRTHAVTGRAVTEIHKHTLLWRTKPMHTAAAHTSKPRRGQHDDGDTGSPDLIAPDFDNGDWTQDAPDISRILSRTSIRSDDE